MLEGAVYWFGENVGERLMAMRMDDHSMIMAFKALSDPTRITIIRLLQGKELCANELRASFNIS